MRRATIISTLLLSFVAHAYIPPTFFWTRQLTQRLKDIKTVGLRTTVVAYENDLPTSNQFKETLLVDVPNKLLESHVLDEEGAELCSAIRELTLGNVLQTPLSNFIFFESEEDALAMAIAAHKIPFKREIDYLADRVEKIEKVTLKNAKTDKSEKEKPMKAEKAERDKQPDISKALEKYRDVQPEKTSLRRWNDGFAWVGAEDPADLARPQLWLAKDLFQPVRLISQNDGVLHEEIFSQYQAERGFTFPRETRLLLKASTRLVAISEKPTVNFKLPKNSLIAEGSSERGVRCTEKGKGLSGTVQELIRDFYRYVR